MERQRRNGISAIFAVDTDHIGALDGVRAIAVLLVLWFHFWQQTWLMPTYKTPFLNWMGVAQIYPDVFRRVGYLCVDMLLLLSSFLLYLPYARNTFKKTPLERTVTFFRKRIARIVPSYLFATVFMFIAACLSGAYSGKTSFAVKDLLTHLTFTQMLFNDTYLFTSITAVMWTVCIEVALYLIFPLLGRAFQRKPLLIYAIMVLLGVWFANGIAPAIGEARIMENRFPTFLPVFANGMMAAHLYVWYAEKVKRKAIPSILGTLAAAAAVYGIVKLFHACAGTGNAGNQQIWQMQYRYPLSLAFTVFMLGGSISIKPVRKLLDNRVLSAISAISYNLYLWHQWLIVRLCGALGAKSGKDIANGGPGMQWTVTVTALVIAFAVAALLTYGLEKPVARLILHTGKEKQ